MIWLLHDALGGLQAERREHQRRALRVQRERGMLLWGYSPLKATVVR
jgi:hypothetical protein